MEEKHQPIQTSLQENPEDETSGQVSSLGRSTQPEVRKMVRAELLGRHSHPIGNSRKQVHIWRREETFLVRGRYREKQFGETLGNNLQSAETRLIQILNELQNETYRPPQHPSRKNKPPKPIGHATIEDVIRVYLCESQGRKTTQRYRNWLNFVLTFSRQPVIRDEYPYAMNIDRNFVIKLREYLHLRHVPRNGRGQSAPRLMARRSVGDILRCFKAAIKVAKRADIGLLPEHYVNPITSDMLGRKPSKDPLRRSPLPVEIRIRLIREMDRYELIHLAPSLVLPARPSEMTGLLVDDIDWETNLISFGDRFGGDDFTKGHQAWSLLIPPEIRLLLCYAVADRDGGPVLRSRRVFEGQAAPEISVESPEGFEDAVRTALLEASSGNSQDAKEVVRRVIVAAGGVSPDELSKQFKRVCQRAGLPPRLHLYMAREAITTELETAKIPQLFQRYMTGHSTDDIMTVYTGLDPEQLMIESGKHWEKIRILLDAISERAKELEIECQREAA